MDLSYLGISEKFPLQPDDNSRVKLIDGVDNIEQSMRDILSTPIGTRFYNEYYGSYLDHLTFEQNDAILANLLYYHTADALRTWEKRIAVVDVIIKIETEIAQCQIIYLILASNQIQALIYPFYREITQ